MSGIKLQAERQGRGDLCQSQRSLLNFYNEKSIMTEAKSEIRLKFNQLPEAKPVANKKVELSLTNQNGVVFTALIDAKSWCKAEADVATFSDWGRDVSGKLGQPTTNGFEVIEAGIKVFENKPKESKPEDAANSCADTASIS